MYQKWSGYNPDWIWCYGGATGMGGYGVGMEWVWSRYRVVTIR